MSEPTDTELLDWLETQTKLQLTKLCDDEDCVWITCKVEGSKYDPNHVMLGEGDTVRLAIKASMENTK